MKIINQNKEEIFEYDLNRGYLIEYLLLKPDATPIDNETKFVWDIKDFEEVKMYIEFKEKSKEQQILELKSKLSSTDYKVIKCSECQLLGQEMPYNVAELHAERQAIRDQINELEKEE